MEKVKGTLVVKGLTTLSKVGCLPTEQKVPQPIEVDLEMDVDLEKAAERDSIRDALDYRSVCEVVRGMLESNTYRLLESAAYAIARRLLERFKEIRSVRIEVRKPHPAIPVPLHFAAVSLTLDRSEQLSADEGLPESGQQLRR